MQVSAPEDTILMKLHWASFRWSEKQFRDAVRVYEVQFGNLDLNYIESWSDRLWVKSYGKVKAGSSANNLNREVLSNTLAG